MPEELERRLPAILAADIAGYSALMGANEEATVRDLKAHQAVILVWSKNWNGGRTCSWYDVASLPKRVSWW